jgi:hydroxymethylpyrimidine/phosphomethylpyrimidine kinase
MWNSWVVRAFSGVLQLQQGYLQAAILRYSHAMKVPPIVLSIAGYDPSSGAGVTADVKTAAAQGCYAVTCITALTVQSSQGVLEMRPVEPDLVQRTTVTLAHDLDIAAVRVGMLGSAAVAKAVVNALGELDLPNIVVDPVLRSSSGTALLDGPGLQVLREDLLPLAEVVTPNVDEAAALAGVDPLPMESPSEDVLSWLSATAGRVRSLGSRAVVITCGHLKEPNDYVNYTQNRMLKEEILPGVHIRSGSTHGTGCAFATSIACQLALGKDILEAVRIAKDYVRRAIESAYPLGEGTGPINHKV